MHEAGGVAHDDCGGGCLGRLGEGERGTERHLGNVVPLDAAGVGVQRIEAAGISGGYEQRVADDHGLRAHRGRLRESDDPGNVEVFHLLAREAGLFGGLGAVGVVGDAEGRGRTRRAVEPHFARLDRAARGVDPRIVRAFRCGQPVDQLCEIVGRNILGLDLHVAKFERVFHRGPVELADGLERGRAALAAIVVAGGAPLIIDGLAWMLAGGFGAMISDSYLAGTGGAACCSQANS